MNPGRFTGDIQRSSVKNNGNQITLWPSFASDVSNAGRYVAFQTTGQISSADTNGQYDVAIRDKATSTTAIVSLTSTGAPGNGASYGGTLSDDGNVVAYQSAATNMVGLDGNGNQSDIFELNRITGQLTLLSKSSQEIWGNGSSRAPVMSGDAAFVAYVSQATNLTTDPNSGEQIYFHQWVGNPAHCVTTLETRQRKVSLLLALLIGLAGMNLPGKDVQDYDPDCTSPSEPQFDPDPTQQTDPQVIDDTFPSVSTPIGVVPVPLRHGNLLYGRRHISVRHGWGPVSRSLADQTLHLGTPQAESDTRTVYVYSFTGANGKACIAEAVVVTDDFGFTNPPGILGLLTFYALGAV